MLFLCGSFAWAQEEEDTPLRLPEPEIQRLRAILAAPVDLNVLKIKVDEAYQQKDIAAWKLGDTIQREANLRAWAQVQPEARWNLRNFLAGTEKRPEAYAMDEALIKEVKFPQQAVRMRCHIALDYIEDSNLKQAAVLINEAEKIIQWIFAEVI